MKKLNILFITLLALLALAFLQAPLWSVTPQNLSLDAKLPIDPEIIHGKLDNGVRYYIRVNKKPENRAELRLVLNAGSVLEDDDQQGLAHFTEHMCFNGTRHFKKHELVNFLESVGMRFGPDLNAYTSFDETVYMLQIPTDSAEVVKKAFQVLEDWAHWVSFEDEEIEKERGVVIEEWRLGRGADARMRDKQFPILFKNSRYAERLPIGKKAVLDTFHHATLRRYYGDWYRPNLMGVVAVGDFDPAEIKGLIEEHFASLKNPTNPRPRIIFPVPDHDETLFAIATDPEASRSSVSLYYKMDVEEQETVQDYRRMIVERLYNSMLNQRLSELTKTADPPFLYAFSAKGRFVRSKDIYFLAAGVKDNGIERGLEALLTEAERVRQFGFTASEMERMKSEVIRDIERAYKERDKTESRLYASEYIRNYLSHEPIPGIEYEFELYKKYLPGIEVEEINQLANQWLSNKSRVVMVNAPEKPGVKVPDESELLAVFEAVKTKKIEAYVDAVSGKPLVESAPAAADIIGQSQLDEIGTVEWKLANGVRVVLKPTDFKNDEIRFTAYSPGGNSLVPDEDYIPAVTAASVIEESGVGEFNQIELEKKLAGKVVSVSPYIGEITEGISGSASPQDLETMFQLIYLYFTQPRKDETAFRSYKARMKGFIENRSARPEVAFQDTIQVTMAQHHFRARPWSLALLEEMDLEKSYRIYRDRFADASDFTFFFVGNFTYDQIKPFVQTYLGGLPSANRAESWRDVGIEPPKGVIDKVVRKGIEPKSLVRIIFSGPYQWSRENNYVLRSMVSAMRIRMREVLREDLGGTYGVGIWSSTTHFPKEEYRVNISFGCAPERVEELTGTVFQLIDSLQQYGIDESYVSKVKEMQIRKYETDLKKNRYWLNALNSYYLNQLDPVKIIRYKELVETLDREKIQKAAQHYFNINNYVRVVLYPEKTE